MRACVGARTPGSGVGSTQRRQHRDGQHDVSLARGRPGGMGGSKGGEGRLRWTTRTRLELDRWTITLYYERCSLLLLGAGRVAQPRSRELQ